MLLELFFVLFFFVEQDVMISRDVLHHSIGKLSVGSFLGFL